MKNNLLTLLLAAMFISSCSEEFLDIQPLDRTTSSNYYKNDDQVLSGSGALYSRPWWGYNYRFSNCLETLSGSAYNTAFDGNFLEFCSFEITPQNGYNNAGFDSFYSVISLSNTFLIDLENAENISPNIMSQAKGEAYFMRAVAHFYLMRVYGEVPISTEREQLLAEPNYFRNDLASLERFISTELMKAASFLPDNPSEPGRVCKMTAIAMLAKFYNYIGDQTEARNYALQVIQSNRYSLRPNYGDLFNKPEFDNNNEESIFSLQWTTVGREFFVTNSNQLDLAGSQALTGFLAYSAYRPSLHLQKTYEPGDLRKEYTLFEPGKVYPDYNTKGEFGDGFRLERDSETTMDRTNANFRKYIVGGPDEYPGTWQEGSTKDTNILRYADILLIYAESFMEGGKITNPLAMAAFNQVRNRAGLSSLTEVSMKDYFKERYLEFVLEGDFFFDLQRMSSSKGATTFSPDAITFSVEQRRGYVYATVFPNVLTERPEGSYYPIDFSFRGKNSKLPIPQSAFDFNSNLSKPAVPYNFN
jgi:starch-binding outer membrane protein, SusD/RagB family